MNKTERRLEDTAQNRIYKLAKLIYAGATIRDLNAVEFDNLATYLRTGYLDQARERIQKIEADNAAAADLANAERLRSWFSTRDDREAGPAEIIFMAKVVSACAGVLPKDYVLAEVTTERLSLLHFSEHSVEEAVDIFVKAMTNMQDFVAKSAALNKQGGAV